MHTGKAHRTNEQPRALLLQQALVTTGLERPVRGNDPRALSPWLLLAPGASIEAATALPGRGPGSPDLHLPDPLAFCASENQDPAADWFAGYGVSLGVRLTVIHSVVAVKGKSRVCTKSAYPARCTLSVCACLDKCGTTKRPSTWVSSLLSRKT